jgi:predicted Zn-dependent peptidase
VKPLIEKYFGPIPAGPAVARPDIAQPVLEKSVEATLEDKNVDAPRLSFVWHGVKQYSADEPAGDVLSFILGQGRTSRLYRSLVFEKQVASDVEASNPTLGLGGMFSIDVTANQGHTVAELRPLVQAIVDDVKKNGVKPEELARAKRNIEAQQVRGLERIGGFGGKADLLNQYQTFTGDPGFLSKDLARYRAVTAEQVQAFANTYLSDDHRLVLDVEPAAKSTASK